MTALPMFGGLFDAIKTGLGSLGNETLGVPVIGDMLTSMSGVKAPSEALQPNGDMVTTGGFNNPTGSIITPAATIAADKAKDKEKQTMQAAMAPVVQQMGQFANSQKPMPAPGAINTGQGQASIKPLQMPQINFGQMLQQRFGRSQ